MLRRNFANGRCRLAAANLWVPCGADRPFRRLTSLVFSEDNVLGISAL